MFLWVSTKDHSMKGNTHAVQASLSAFGSISLLKITGLLWNKSPLTLAVEMGSRNNVKYDIFTIILYHGRS